MQPYQSIVAALLCVVQGDREERKLYRTLALIIILLGVVGIILLNAQYLQTRSIYTEVRLIHEKLEKLVKNSKY